MEVLTPVVRSNAYFVWLAEEVLFIALVVAKVITSSDTSASITIAVGDYCYCQTKNRSRSTC
jgi:hypothetical protein